MAGRGEAPDLAAWLVALPGELWASCPRSWLVSVGVGGPGAAFLSGSPALCLPGCPLAWVLGHGTDGVPHSLAESPARYSNKELKGMLVWSPNHCVSDAKCEWLPPGPLWLRCRPHPCGCGCWRVTLQGQAWGRSCDTPLPNTFLSCLCSGQVHCHGQGEAWLQHRAGKSARGARVVPGRGALGS